MVTTFYPPYHFGGDAIFVQSLARALTAQGHEVEVVHCEDAYRLGSGSAQSLPMEHDGIVVHRLHSPLGLLSPLITQQTGRPGLKAHKLHAILERDFDVVNFHNISLVGGPGVLGMSKAPVNLYTLHEHWLLCPMHIFWKNRQRACDRPQCVRCCIRSGIPPQLWRYSSLIERSLSTVDALLSPSEYTAQRHREAGFNVPIYVVPLFSVFEPSPLPQEVHQKRPYFLFVGHVTASKGIASLLEDFAPLQDYDLLVVGEGDLQSSLQRQYAKYPHIRFLGYLPHSQLVPLYQKATAVVLPSLAPESFGLCVIEAFACGTPAVVRAAGGNREAIDRTGGGFVYESRAGLYQALAALTESPHLRETIGRRAREGYEKYYTEERYAMAYLDLVETIRQKKVTNSANQ